MNKDIFEKHGPANIASAMSESTQTICNWRSRGVPLEKVIEFCRAVNWDITPHKLRPDNYPHPDDGLPTELRPYKESHEPCTTAA